jgi:hypothetical protein
MPAIPEERIRLLIQKYLTDTLTPADDEELDELIIEYPQVLDILDQMRAKGLASPAFQQRQQEVLQRGLAKAKAMLFPPDDALATDLHPMIPIPAERKKGIKWPFYMAAAVLLGIIVGGIFIWLHKQITAPDAPALASTIKKERVPDFNKAVLTLANGKTIRLDGTLAGKKLLEQEGGGIVLKDSGIIVYTNGTITDTKGTIAHSEGTIAYTAGDGAGTAFNTLTTPRGGRYQVILPDGTKVWLNNASSLRYPIAFSGNTREVALTGEAYFEVAKNSAKPFTVTANAINVHVLGTAFNIKAYTAENLHAVLLEGKVRVQGRDASCMLTKGEALTTRGKNKWEPRRDKHAAEAIAWIHGELDFRDTPLSEILQALALRYDVELDTTGMRNDPPCELLGISQQMPLVDVLKILATVGQFHIEGKKLIAAT